jgi:contact-dependent growth inhibition (CDI) system restriction endonuclease-like protein
MTRHAAWHMWRLSEADDDNLGLACSDDGLLLGRTPLIERRDGKFVARQQQDIERLLTCAYRTEVRADRLTSGLATVARALSANDQCLARIAAVHLRIPDIPDRTARDAMEAADVLTKYARDEGGDSNWNPALHPRTGTPPNPGWFAPTGDGGESSPVRTAQNDDSTRLTDASLGVSENRVVLPPGQGNDELRDLFEWIGNAQPEDKQAIRAEIKHQFYDKGDIAGGDAASAALDNVLGSGIGRKDRQKILDALGPYSQSNEDDQTTEFWIGATLPFLAMLPPAAGAEAASAAWELGWAARGLYISEQRGANLPASFPVIDKWLDGVATSIKSIDLTATTYQDATRLTYRLNDYINKLVFFEGADFGIWEIEPSAINGRVLDLVVPKGSMTAAQRTAIEAAKLRARAFGVNLTVTDF